MAMIRSLGRSKAAVGKTPSAGNIWDSVAGEAETIRLWDSVANVRTS